MLWIEKRRFFSVFMLILMGIEIFYISSIPGSKPIGSFGWIPLIYHFSIFFLFSFFVFFFIKGKEEKKSHHAIFALFLSLIYAISDEFHQSFVPFRTPSFGDIIIDLAGISFALLISIFISNRNLSEH